MESKFEMILTEGGIEVKDLTKGKTVFGPEEIEKLPREIFEQLKQNYKKGKGYVIQMGYADLMLWLDGMNEFNKRPKLKRCREKVEEWITEAKGEGEFF